MRTVFFIPPLRRMSGGLAAIYGMIAELSVLGHAVAFTCPGEADGLPELLGGQASGATRLPWNSLVLTPDDLWIVPESWPNAISPGVNSGARTLVYAQSWNFFMTVLPAGVRWKQLPVEYLAVSRPVAWFMERVLELPVSGILPPAVNPVFFAEAKAREVGCPGKDGAPGADNASSPRRSIVRVAWLPRKNRALAEQVRHVAERALERLEKPVRVEWLPLQNLTQAELARELASCQIFLSTAFPEGFGLGPLEAMASGCVPVGFTGFGGWEYMRQAALPRQSAEGVDRQADLSPLVSLPSLPTGSAFPNKDLLSPASFRGALHSDAFPGPELLPDFMPEGGNGLYFQDGDILGAGLGLAYAVEQAAAGDPSWELLRANGKVTADCYSAEKKASRLKALWMALLKNSRCPA